MAKNLTPPGTVRKQVFLVEDHPTFREGLAQILNGEPDLAVCGHASTAEEALPAIARLMPDMALVDLSLPGKNGLELIKELRQVNRKTKILVVSMHDEALYASRVLRAGGDGYIMKQEDTEDIINAIRDVLAGHIHVSEEVMCSLPKTCTRSMAREKARPIDRLTDPELEVLELLGRGKDDREIARELQMTLALVKLCNVALKKKLNLKSANALLRYAVCWVETGSA
jgi:DNA-binding NarL/FixJ family response regulator